MIKKILLTLVVLFSAVNLSTSQNKDIFQELSDSAYVSILTTYPNDQAVYTIFGHSAMRVKDPGQGIDIVFNYGIFNFNAPNFMYRFTAGETDYMVMAIDYAYYLPEYQMRGVELREQKIDLTLEEKNRIWEFLLNNIQTENRVYRYNIFFNNCTTKLADILEENVDGKIDFAKNIDNKTFRNVLHEHLEGLPWLKFGIDIIIGSEADRIMSTKEKIFLPIYEYQIFNESEITNYTNHTRPLVSSDTAILSAREDQNKSQSKFPNPLVVGIGILILSIITCYYSLKKRCIASGIFHSTLYLVAGILGTILFFMMYFSVHPCTNPNWNLVWLNPIQLIVAFLFFVKLPSKRVYYYHFVNFVALSLFLLAWCLIPQQLEIAFIPFILSLWAISGTQLIKCKRLNKS